jgi:hypothetical protein
MKYDPNKKWTWKPSDKFEMSGEQFSFILNSFRAILSTPEAQRILYIYNANNAVESIIAKAVEDGVVVEAPLEEKVNVGVK